MMNPFLSNDVLYCIYDDDGDSTFRVGYFLLGDDTNVLFHLATTRGYEDGFYLTSFDRIHRVSYGDRYSNRILKLLNINGQQKAEIQLDSSMPLVQALLAYSKEQAWLVTIEFDDEDQLTGQVIAVNDDAVTVGVVDDDGAEDGVSVLRTDSIVRIWSNTGWERNLQALQNTDAERN